jgi:lipid-binding SYLF domain-containing protein
LTLVVSGPNLALEANEAQDRVTDAVSVVRAMSADPQVSALVQEAKGLLIVPRFLKAALVFGGQAGPALMLVQRNGRWSDPAFYRTHSGSFGAQIGATRGALVMILTSDRAVQAFTVKTTSWSLNVGAGLTAASYSKDMQQPASRSDVVIWSDSKGLFGGAAVGATRVAIDERANRQYYDHADVTCQQILSGLVANPYSNRLREVLVMQRAAK